ncbi:glycoside hydrolase family 30 beta sandwich domain-containing protein [Weeksellaceae bacterium A-14]|uniref:glycoside hydrolase family 30 protein n=1 Tax=Daejeonia sp. YH14 TaxID=3439042 RepID=UPI0031E4BFE7
MPINTLYSFLKSAVPYSMALFVFYACSTNSIAENDKGEQIDYWLTSADGHELLQKQASIFFDGSVKNDQLITINPDARFQTVDGFGFTLTGGSVQVLNKLSSQEKNALLQELFGFGDKDIRINYLRIGIGASDLDAEVFSYDDLKEGETDPELKKFSMAKSKELITILKQILNINPDIKIIATPWSAPVWMKDNGKSIGGSLKPEFYGIYARYFVKYIQEMAKLGIPIDAVTPQNEPLHPGNNPSMYMSAEQQKIFIRDYLGPEFRKNAIDTKIVVYDHNCNQPEYPISILDDPEARQYIDGSAFHLYEGDISALTTVHNAYPDKNLYFTEQWTGAKGTFAEDLIWHTKNVIIGSMNNWSKTALEWNLANDEYFRPHTPGGCTECKGAITITENGNIQRNVGYYIIAHASKFIPSNSVRIGVQSIPGLDAVAFHTPQGKTVLIILNSTKNEKRFTLAFRQKTASAYLAPETVSTFIF